MQLDLGLNLGIYNEFRKALDFLSVQSSAAYSLRKLRNAYTGSAIRVRRSLDNAEADIGFSGTDLDTTALTNFVGSQNLLQHSEAFDNAYWGKSASSVTATNIVSPTGTSNAELINFLSGGMITLNLSGWTAGTIATLSVWVRRASSGSASHFRITSNNTALWNTGQTTKVLLTNEWQRVSLSGNLVTSGISLGVRFGSRDIAGVEDPDCVGNVEMWGAQLNQGTLQPYSPTTRRNLLTFTEAFDNVIWRKLGTGTGSDPVVTPNAGVAPDGTQTADQVVFNLNGGTTSSDRSALDQQAATTITGQPYVYSVWMRTTDGSNKTIQLSANGALNINCNVTPTWQRFSLVYPSALDTARYIVIRLRGTFGTSDSASVLMWGVQQENSTTLTEYQRVDGTWASTRDGNGFITTWYDQSGNGRNATQATAANQPSIVTAGVVNTVNGKPVQRFNGSEWLSFSSLTLTDFATIWVSRKRDATVVSQSIILARSGLSRPYAGDDVNGVGNPNVSGAGSDIVRTTLGNTSPSGGEDALHTSYAQRIGNQATGGMNGQVNPNATVETASMILNIIGRYTNLEIFNYVGDLTELMMMESALTTTDRQTLERNQGSYYNITVS